MDGSTQGEVEKSHDAKVQEPEVKALAEALPCDRGEDERHTDNQHGLHQSRREPAQKARGFMRFRANAPLFLLSFSRIVSPKGCSRPEAFG
jgi:hypothetical protein